MAYTLGAPKRIEEGGITFLVRCPFGIAFELERETRKFLENAAQLERLSTQPANESPEAGERRRERAQQVAAETLELQDQLQARWMRLIVGWEGVVDEAGEPVPYSIEALTDGVDVAIVEAVLGRIKEAERDRGRERAEKNVP